MFVGIINGDVIKDVRLELFFFLISIFESWFSFDEMCDALFCFVLRRIFFILVGIWVLRMDVVFMIVMLFFGLKNEEF